MIHDGSTAVNFQEIFCADGDGHSTKITQCCLGSVCLVFLVLDTLVSMWWRFYLVIVGCIATLANRAQSIPGGAVLWLDAARGVEINQSLVTGWKDFSGQAHHAVM